MGTIKECKQELVETLEKFMSRDKDIDKNEYTEIDLELVEVKFGRSFIVYVDNNKFNINFFTSSKTAKYVYNNIDSVTYIHWGNMFFDTLVGNISDFVVNELGFDSRSDNYFTAMQLYEQFIRKSDTIPTLETIISYIEERI